MSKAIRRIFFPCVLCLSLLLACATTPPASPLAQLIPGNASIVLLAQSPRQFYAGLDELWNKTGLRMLAGGSLDKVLCQALALNADELSSLDFDRPWALAFIPDGAESSDVKPLLIAPFRGDARVLESQANKLELSLAFQSKGYAFFAKKDLRFSFPPKAQPDLSRLYRYPKSALALWLSPEALARLGEQGSLGQALNQTGNAELSAGLVTLVRDFVRDLRSIDAALIPDGSGLRFSAGFAAKRGSNVDKTLARMGALPSAQAWLSKIERDALFSFAAAAEPQTSRELSLAMMKALTGTLKLPNDFFERLDALQTKWNMALGPRSLCSFDMDIDVNGLKAFDSSDPAAVRALFKALRFKIDVVQEARDPAKLQSLVRGISTDPDTLSLMNSYTELSGIEYAMRQESKFDEGQSYEEIGISMRVADNDKAARNFSGSDIEEISDMLSSLGSLFTMRTGLRGKLLAYTTQRPARLWALLENAAAENPVSEDPAYQSFAKTMPAKPIVISSFSLGRLFDMMKKIMASTGRDEGKVFRLIDPRDFGSWYSCIAVSGAPARAAECHCLVPASDIEAMVKLFILFGKNAKTAATLP